MPKLTPEKRDDLLIRLDERVGFIREEALPKMEDHLMKINNRLDKHGAEIVRIGTLQKERNTPSKKTIGSIIAGAIALVVALWKAFTGS